MKSKFCMFAPYLAHVIFEPLCQQWMSRKHDQKISLVTSTVFKKMPAETDFSKIGNKKQIWYSSHGCTQVLLLSINPGWSKHALFEVNSWDRHLPFSDIIVFKCKSLQAQNSILHDIKVFHKLFSFTLKAFLWNKYLAWLLGNAVSCYDYVTPLPPLTFTREGDTITKDAKINLRHSLVLCWHFEVAYW